MKTKVTTIIRCTLLVAALVFEAATKFGVGNTAVSILGTVVVVAAAAWAAWKNNSFTTAAQMADSVMKWLKSEETDEDTEVVKLLIRCFDTEEKVDGE